MDTTKQPQSQTQTTQPIDCMVQDRGENENDYGDYDYYDSYDLIEFGIASNGGRLSITDK